MKLDDIWAAVISVVLAVTGGLVRLLNLKDEKALKFSRILAELLTAAFTGGLIFLLSREVGFGNYMLFLLAGVAGWLGPKVLDALGKVFQDKTGLKISEEEATTTDDGKDDEK